MENVSPMTFPFNNSVVSRQQFDQHMTLYKGYVSKTNEITKVLTTQPEYDTANATAGHYRGWKKGETYAINGMILHELYFQNLGAEPSQPGPHTLALMDKYFGGKDNWQKDFIACATSARGWCILAYEQRTSTCRNILLDSHDDGQIATAYPIIVLDMYEHAYFTDYGTDKATYIARFIANIPWDVIERRAAAVA
ncbi:MAG: Fe-Mn family superoxide dismutase [Defluviitaleaceae bacterium]|nr:Fe-Mn family superoxide dismutase [Defluviitaleaceae bacterium]